MLKPPSAGFARTIVCVAPARHAATLAHVVSIGLCATARRWGGRNLVCHLGQPVPIGEGAALRFCASAPMITDVARRMSAGQSLERAFAPVATWLQCAFDKWEALAKP